MEIWKIVLIDIFGCILTVIALTLCVKISDYRDQKKKLKRKAKSNYRASYNSNVKN